MTEEEETFSREEFPIGGVGWSLWRGRVYSDNSSTSVEEHIFFLNKRYFNTVFLL